MPKESNLEQKRTWWRERDGEYCQAMVDCLNRNRYAYLVSADSAGRIIGYNDALAELLGLDPDQVKDESIWDKLVETDALRIKERLKAAQVGTEPLLLN